MHRGRIARSYGSLFWIFLRQLHTLIMVIPVNILIRVHKDPLFSICLPTLVFWYSHSDRCEMIPHVVLICIFLISDIEHLFMCLSSHFHVLFGKMSIQILCLFFTQIVGVFCLFLLLSCISSLCMILGITLLPDKLLATIFFFHSVVCLFTSAFFSFHAKPF